MIVLVPQSAQILLPALALARASRREQKPSSTLLSSVICTLVPHAPVPAQVPALHTSPLVQGLPSSQLSVLLVFTQPVVVLQVLVVQTLPSSQAISEGVKVQPTVASQLLAVQSILSSHTSAAPLTQLPPLQVSATVQAFLSLHPSVLLLFTQPTSVLQLSVVQTLPSSQRLSFATFLQPVCGSQLSAVQAKPSSQVLGLPPLQLPPLQFSPTVQTSPSSQAPVLARYAQPFAVKQKSTVHWLPSSQSASLVVWLQPVVPLQLSAVQAKPSSQLCRLPLQMPAVHLSPAVQASLSLQTALSLAPMYLQPLAGSHKSLVHTLLSLQVIALPWHLPLAHASPLVQALPSLQFPLLLGVN